MSRSCEEDPAFDYLLMLLLDTSAGSLTVLPTHRVVRGLGDEGVEFRAAFEDRVERQRPREAAADQGKEGNGNWSNTIHGQS